MSNNAAKSVGNTKKIRSALERIETLEADMVRIVEAINTGLQKMQAEYNGNANGLAETLEAVIMCVGEEPVKAALESNRLRKAHEGADKAKAALEQAVADGTVVVTDSVGERTLIVGRETDAEGNIIPPGRVQLTWESVKPEFQDQLLGAGVGAKLATPNGGSFEVVEIFDFVTKDETAPETTPAAE